MTLLRSKLALTLGLTSLLLTLSSAAEAQDYFDDVNGIWIVTNSSGTQLSGTALTESYPEIGVRMRLQGKVASLTKTGNTLTSAKSNVGMTGAVDGNTPSNTPPDVVLELTGLDTPDPADDGMKGTWFGRTYTFKRDVRAKAPIQFKLPGDRPWVRFMDEVLIPKTAEDRESYHEFDAASSGEWLRSCQLYASGYWLYKYMAGKTRAEEAKYFQNVVTKMDKVKVTPRSILKSSFPAALKPNLNVASKTSPGLALANLGMYFSTAAGGAVRMQVTDNADSMVYYITDRRRTSKLGLCVMATPTHKPLASSFGKWLLDFSEMPITDNEPFARCLLETMAKSSTKAANNLSPTGRSAFTDYLGVMAIEDQRGVMFDNRDLRWGYNMTSASFCALISRALSHGEMRKGPDKLGGKQELASKVIVEDWSSDAGVLQPGNVSYFDVLNGADDVLQGGKTGGNDMQEIGGMATLKKLTTDWLKEKHPELMTRIEKAFASFIPADELSFRAKEDVFHLMCENFYDVRFGKVTKTQATEVVNAGMEIMKAINAESRDLEAFILAHGVTASPDWAPRASGF